MSTHTWLVAFVWLIGVPQPARTEEPTAAQLLAEGDKLADKMEYTEALLRYKAAYEKILPDLRGLRFCQPVAPQFMERSALQEQMKKLFHEESSDEDIALSDASLKVFGFVAADFKTEEMVLNLYSEEVAGFYDPRRKQIFLIKEPANPTKPGLLEKLFGARSGFDKDEQKATLAHEMAHALADQHFDLVQLEKAAEHDDDRALALHALVEGEATLVMMADMLRGQPGGGRDVLKSSPQAMDASLKVMQWFLPFASGKTFRNAPPIFRETMLFSYFKGLVFVLHLTNEDEWKSVDGAFRHPPLSTEQILHPEKFSKDRDEPVDIVLPPLGELLGPEWKEIGQNVLGELQISVLLRRHWGTLAAAGWGGDRYAVFRDPDGKLGLVWFTNWDTPEDAQEFAGAYSQYLTTKLDPAATAAVKDSKPPTVPDRFRLERAGRFYQILRHDSDVVVLEGFSESETEALAPSVFKAQKKPKE